MLKHPTQCLYLRQAPHSSKTYVKLRADALVINQLHNKSTYAGTPDEKYNSGNEPIQIPAGVVDKEPVKYSIQSTKYFFKIIPL